MAQPAPPAPHPALPDRTLRCANAHFYMLMQWVLAALWVYYALSGKLSTPAIIGFGAAIALAIFWALHYTRLRYQIDAAGITRRTRTATKTHLWSELTAASARQHEANGIISCSVVLTFDKEEWCISSDLFSPDDVQELSAALADAGLLPAEQNLMQEGN